MDKTILEKEFYLPKKLLKKSYFERNGFKYTKIYDAFAYRFVAWRYGSAGTLEGEIRIDETGQVSLDCFDYGSRYRYASWYCRDDKIKECVFLIDKKFLEEINRLGIRER